MNTEQSVIVITGAGGGLGAAMARRFASRGARLALLDYRSDTLETLASSLDTADEDRLLLPCDVSSEADVDAAFARVTEHFGQLDGAFLNAGIEGGIAPIEDYDIDMYERVMAVNVRGVFLGMQHAIRLMKPRGQGSIVLTSSLAGLRGSRKIAPYTASKHAVVGLMKSASLECASRGVRINTVNPAPIATRMIEALEEGYAPGSRDTIKEKMERAVPMRRYGQPEEVANLALFLLSDESSYITGNTYPVDGGMSAG